MVVYLIIYTLVTTATLLASACAATAYLNAKFNLSVDLEQIYEMKRAQMRYAKTGKMTKCNQSEVF